MRDLTTTSVMTADADTESGRLVGIVTRADLVRAFTRSDEEIAPEVNAILIDRSLLEETLRQLPGVVSVDAALMSRSHGRDFRHVPFV